MRHLQNPDAALTLLVNAARVDPVLRQAVRLVDQDRRQLQALIRDMLENDPNDLAADGGVTVLDVWREEAARTLGDAQ